MQTGGWVHEVLAVVDGLEVIVALVDEWLVGCPLVTVNDRARQHDSLNDWNQRHCPAVLDKLQVLSTCPQCQIPTGRQQGRDHGGASAQSVILSKQSFKLTNAIVHCNLGRNSLPSDFLSW